MSEMVEWLRATIEGDLTKARAATDGPWSVNNESYAETIYGADDTHVVSGGRWGGEASVFDSTEDALHIIRHDPRNVIADCEAKLKVIAKYEGSLLTQQREPDNERNNGYALGMGSAIAAILQGYRHRDGYKQGWAADQA